MENVKNVSSFDCCETACIATVEELPAIHIEDVTTYFTMFSGCAETPDIDVSVGNGYSTNIGPSDLIYDNRIQADVYRDYYTRPNGTVNVPTFNPQFGPIISRNDGEGCTRVQVNGEWVYPCPDTTLTLCQTLHDTYDERLRYYLYASYRKKKIKVYIFKYLVQLNGRTPEQEEPICQWFIVSRLTIGTKCMQLGKYYRHMTSTAAFSGCCKALNLFDVSIPEQSDADLFAYMNANAVENDHYVWGAKAYLTLPAPGTVITFSETDILDPVIPFVYCAPINEVFSVEYVSSDPMITTRSRSPIVGSHIDLLPCRCEIVCIMPDPYFPYVPGFPETVCLGVPLQSPDYETSSITSVIGINGTTQTGPRFGDYSSVIYDMSNPDCYFTCLGAFGLSGAFYENHAYARIDKQTVRDLSWSQTIIPYYPRTLTIPHPGTWQITL